MTEIIDGVITRLEKDMEHIYPIDDTEPIESILTNITIEIICDNQTMIDGFPDSLIVRDRNNILLLECITNYELDMGFMDNIITTKIECNKMEDISNKMVLTKFKDCKKEIPYIYYINYKNSTDKCISNYTYDEFNKILFIERL